MYDLEKTPSQIENEKLEAERFLTEKLLRLKQEILLCLELSPTAQNLKLWHKLLVEYEAAIKKYCETYTTLCNNTVETLRFRYLTKFGIRSLTRERVNIMSATNNVELLTFITVCFFGEIDQSIKNFTLGNKKLLKPRKVND